MIWYLLYPFRGTTDPPNLNASHPFRKFFTNYGNEAARHPVITLLISVAAATILIYPFPFLYTNNYTNGVSNLPHHVWTSAQPFGGDPSTQPDVVMRSIWVHGSYMKALLPEVLQTALELQDELLGPTIDFNPRRPEKPSIPDFPSLTNLTPDIRDTIHAVNGLSNQSWFFHSPLQYWGCSSEAIVEDKDIISTVNSHSHQSTSVNVTLRHSIVFSGKRFEDHQLVAADALVITLVHMLDSPLGRHWERKAKEIAQRTSGKWAIYPTDGLSPASTLYEFRFQPLSVLDDFLLGGAYIFATWYFLRSVSQLRALKSRTGLLFAIFAQITASIMSSFTICAIFKIDLSKLPRFLYPFVVVVFGLENIFRLINSVIMTPPENSAPVRIKEALGQTGHIALASVTQNSFIILGISTRLETQGLTNFCYFIVIAILFDFFYLLTFFIAVLSIDVRRLELSDSLTRATRRSRKYKTEPELRKSWIEALRKGEGPLSTRVAGTLVFASFVLIAQWHFTDNESLTDTASRLVRLLRLRQSRKHVTGLSMGLNQARTPTAWLKMQDHESAHEVINIIKPGAYSYIARVYDPLIVLLDGSNRTTTNLGVRRFLPAVYDFVRHQSTPFIITVLLVVAGVSLLMNYLLWDEVPEAQEDRPEDDPLLSVKTLKGGHSLDIVLLASSKDGVIASVGLDRRIRIWDVRGMTNYTVHDPDSEVDPFPVLAMAIDSDSNWLALLSKGQVALWNIPEKRWGSTIEVEVRRTPASFFFGYSATEFIHPLIVVRHNGLMTELDVENNVYTELQICKTPLVCVKPYIEKPPTSTSQPPPIRIITSSRRGCVHVASQSELGWISEEVPCATGGDEEDVVSILPLPALLSFLAIRNSSVELIDIVTQKVTHTFTTQPIKPDTLHCFHSTRRRPQCGSVGLAYLALAYTNAESGQCILQLYLPEREGDTICFRDPWTPGSKTCCLWKETIEETRVVDNPGHWEALQIGYIVGVRKCLPKYRDTHHPTTNSGLRRRGGLDRRTSADSKKLDDEDKWEVWSLSMRGEHSTAPLIDFQSSQEQLLISDLGPLEKVGKRSIAIGLGNVIKIITIGNERFDGQDNMVDDSAFVGMASSRRKKPGIPRRKS